MMINSHELWNRTSMIEGMYEGELGYECVDGKSFKIKAFFARLWSDCE